MNRELYVLIIFMRIGIDIRTLMGAQYSGIPEYTLNLIKEILELDKKNEYILFYNSAKNVNKNIPKFLQSGLSTINTRYPNKIFNLLMQKGLKIPKIDKLLGVDVFFMPHINFISLSPTVKSVITIHDLSFLRFPEFFSFKKNLWHKLIDVKKTIKNFNCIIAVSENTKNDLIELCDVDSAKIKVVYSGLNKKYKILSSDERATVKQKYGLSDNYILYVGTIEPRKNLSGLIAAFDNLLIKNPSLLKYELVIAGGKGWKFKEVMERHCHAEFRNKIKFLGYVEKKDIPALYNLAQVFVYPSFYEGFGFPPLEASACGCPVIASNLSSLPEVLQKSALTINPYKINELESALKIVLTDEKIKENLLKNSFNFREKFNWQKIARQYIDIFNFMDKS